MTPQVTIKIAMNPQGASIPQGSTAAAETDGEAPQPPALEEDAMAVVAEAAAPGPPTLAELEPLAAAAVDEGSEPPPPEALEAADAARSAR